MPFGKARYGSTQYKKVESLKEGENVIRILPPIHSLEHKGIWSLYHRQHFGYKGTNKNNPEKPLIYTFECPEKYNFRTKEVMVECPECNKIAEVKEDLRIATVDAERDALAKGLKGEAADSYVANSTAPLREFLGEHPYRSGHNVENRCYVNVKKTDNTFTTMKLPHTVKKDIDALIENLQVEENINPIDMDQGVWFSILRSGATRNSTSYAVNVVTESHKEGGKVLKSTRLAPLTTQDGEAALEACYDLADPGIRKLPMDRIVMLVQSGGEPEVVDAIFGTAELATPVTAATPSPAVAVQALTPAAPPRARVTSMADVEVHAATGNMRDVASNMMAETTKLNPSVSTPGTSASVPAPAPVTMKDPSEMSPEEFMARYKLDKR